MNRNLKLVYKLITNGMSEFTEITKEEVEWFFDSIVEKLEEWDSKLQKKYLIHANYVPMIKSKMLTLLKSKMPSANLQEFSRALQIHSAYEMVNGKARIIYLYVTTEEKNTDMYYRKWYSDFYKTHIDSVLDSFNNYDFKKEEPDLSDSIRVMERLNRLSFKI